MILPCTNTPATSRTDEMTGTSQTIVRLLSARPGSDRLADVPEEVDERDGRARDDGRAQADEDAELATLIKKDAQLKSLPVMIVSYKDRETDRLRGLEAGADYYLTKGSFHDETLLQAVVDLIGEPDA